MVKILITEPEYFGAEARKILSRHGTVVAKRLTREELEKRIPEFDAIVVRIETNLDSKILSKAKRLRVIGSATTGLNHIDLRYVKEHGITLINLHGTHTVPTAEHTLALMLSLCRKIPWAHVALSNGEWKRYRFIGMQLSGRTLGIIGLGRIGSQVAVYAKALGMQVIAYDPYAKPREIKLVSLKALLKEADVVTIHAALTDETMGMVSTRELHAMKKNALLINTARGEIVDQRALLKALGRGIIAGAAEDVFPTEPMEDKDALQAYARSHKNLIITPHIAASADTAVYLAGIEIATKVSEALRLYTGQPTHKNS